MIVELTAEEQRMYYSATCNAVLPSLPTNIKQSCKRRKVCILEVGYSSDTKYEEKFQEKTQQHQLSWFVVQLMPCFSLIESELTCWGLLDVHSPEGGPSNPPQ